MYGLRQKLGQEIRENTGDDELSGLIVALATGDRQFIDTKQWHVFSRTGTIHLMAISGLHVGLLYALFYWLGRHAWSLSARLCLRRPAQDSPDPVVEYRADSRRFWRHAPQRLPVKSSIIPPRKDNS